MKGAVSMNRILTFLLSYVLSVSPTGRGEAPGAAREPAQDAQPPTQSEEAQSPQETGPEL